MPSAVRLREDYSAEALRGLARRSKDVNQSRRRLCCKDDRRRWEDGDKLDPISFMRRYRKER